MGDERADRGSDGAREREGDGEGARPLVVTRLRRENERLRERLAERTRERDRIVDRYETLLDAARGSDDADDAERSGAARLLDKLRRA